MLFSATREPRVTSSAEMKSVVYLFSVQVLSIGPNVWEKQPVLFFVDQQGRRSTYVVRDYVPYLLCRPQDDSLEPCDVEGYLDDVRVEEHRMTPLVGFTNNRQDRVFRVYYPGAGQKSRMIQKLEELAVVVLHQ